MEEVVHGLTEAVHASVFGSVALFGHCSGATIAFELAHRLSLDGPARPSLLFPSSATPPHQSWQGDRLSRLADNELVAALRRLGGTPEAVLTNSELLELVLPAVRADFAIQESYVYRPSPPLANPIQAICGARDQSTGPSVAAGWRTYTTSWFEISSFPSDHFFIWQHQESIMRLMCRKALEVA